MTPVADELVWLAIATVALGTLGFRASFVVLFGYVDEVPPRVDRTLRFIPPAVIAAIVGPSLLLVDGAIAVDATNEPLLAGLVAMGVAWYTENMFATLAVGMLALWTLEFVL